MRINYDCIRDVLMNLEDMLVLNENLENNIVTLEELCAALPDYQKQEIAYSLIMLDEAEYIQANIQSCDDCIMDVFVCGITFEGHKYLDTVRSSPIWEETKKTFKEKAIEMTIETIMLVAKSIIQSRLIS